jgi:hypothetical protein
VCEERSVYQRLAAACEIHEVRRARIGGHGHAAPRQFSVSRPQRPFNRLIGSELEPWCHAGQQPSKGLEVRDVATLGLRCWSDLHRHTRPQPPFGEVPEHRSGDARENAGPVFAVSFRWSVSARRQFCPRKCEAGRGNA